MPHNLHGKLIIILDTRPFFRLGRVGVVFAVLDTQILGSRYLKRIFATHGELEDFRLA